jgi:hypothetical protein
MGLTFAIDNYFMAKNRKGNFDRIAEAAQEIGIGQYC